MTTRPRVEPTDWRILYVGFAMDSTLAGLVLVSSVLIAAERRKLTAAQAIEDMEKMIGAAHAMFGAVSPALYRDGQHPQRLERRRAVH